VLTDETSALLDTLSPVVMFGGMGFLVALITGLVGMAVYFQRTRTPAPGWAETLIVTR
jgi:hypothetical protein